MGVRPADAVLEAGRAFRTEATESVRVLVLGSKAEETRRCAAADGGGDTTDGRAEDDRESGPVVVRLVEGVAVSMEGRGFPAGEPIAGRPAVDELRGVPVARTPVLFDDADVVVEAVALIAVRGVSGSRPLRTESRPESEVREGGRELTDGVPNTIVSRGFIPARAGAGVAPAVLFAPAFLFT